MSPKISLAFLLVFFMGIIIANINSLSATPNTKTSDHHNPNYEYFPFPAKRGLGELTASRFLAQVIKPARTCDKSPRVCRARGSPGPSCCGKKCVDVKSDELNCGKCGRKCENSEVCCRGRCVNPSKDERHCGRCNNYCGKGSSCSYGLCGYA